MKRARVPVRGGEKRTSFSRSLDKACVLLCLFRAGAPGSASAGHDLPLMTNRDYTKEIGLPSQTKTFPRPVAFAILALVAVGISFGVVSVLRETRVQHEAEKKLTTPVQQESAQPAPAKP